MEQEFTPSLVGFRDLHRRLGAGRSERAFRVWLWRAVRDGRFPAPLVISANSRAWRADAVAAWEAALRPVSYAPQGS